MFKIGDIIYCEGCKPPVPLARRVSMNEFELIKYIKGEKIKVKTSYEGGSYTVTCEQCGMGHIFAHIKEGISIGDDVNCKTE